jgi:hypothetical protein
VATAVLKPLSRLTSLPYFILKLSGGSMKRQSVHFLWNEPLITNRFSSAVSLHGHTDRSREGLAGIPVWSEGNALIGFAVARISSAYKKFAGKDLDLQRSYFAPPLAPAAAYRMEAQQVEAMDMKPIVSITDHDTIEGPRQLHTFLDPDDVPVSLEWTVPFGRSYFHLGIHNLPANSADDIVDALQNVQCFHCKAAQITCMGTHDARCLPSVEGLLEHVASVPHTLIVMNHPLWDVCGLGESAHLEAVSTFLRRYGKWIHALELNGLRTWQENRDVMALASRWGLPVISGGDRHGCEPNAVVNLTGAESFSQFAGEIRNGETSVVLFLKQYQQPLTFRLWRIVWDVLKTSHGDTGTQKWGDRIFLPWLDGRVLPLSSVEWSAAFSNEPVVGPQPSEGFACDALQGTE